MKPDCITCDRKVKQEGDQCAVCKRQVQELKRRARNVEAMKRKRKAKK